MKEITYRGYRIVQVDAPKELDKFECMGFTMPKAFQVLDDFDEPLLIVPQYFWSPTDAIAAIEMVDTILPERKSKRWPTTAVYEYGLMWAHRRMFWFVYHTLNQIRNELKKAREWDENPTEKIEGLLTCMRVAVSENRARPDHGAVKK